MENKEEKLQLSDYLQICVDIESGKLDPEAGDAAIKDFCSKLIIKNYMKHKEKIIILTTILYRLNNFEDETSVAGFLEMDRIMYGLLGYCVNLNNNVDALGPLFGIYDAIREFGLYDYIMQYCKEDFELFSSMLHDALNIAHIKELSNTMGAFNETDIDQWTMALKEFKEQITPEVLQGLIEYGANNDSATQGLLHSLAEAAVNDSKRDLAKALNPLEAAKEQLNQGEEESLDISGVSEETSTEEENKTEA